MNGAAEIPMPAAILIAGFLLAGGFMALAGAFGLVRLGTFYQRVHAPTLGASLGTFLILAASILYFSFARRQFVVHEALIAVFLTLTTPISLMLVVRAALARDRLEGGSDVPQVDAALADGIETDPAR